MNAPFIIYCCITYYPQTQWLKTTNIYYLLVSVGQELSSDLSGRFWPRVSREASFRMSARAVVTGRLARAGGFDSKMVHLYDLVVAECLLTWVSAGLLEYPHNTVAGFP